jgi:glucose/arabinose dehydrogenase
MAAPDNSIALEPFLSGFGSGPDFITHAGDGSGRLFVLEQGGRIRVVANGQWLDSPYVDLQDTPGTISAGGEAGLLGLAFHPGYRTNGRFFIFYTAPPPPGSDVNIDKLVEYHVSSNPLRADPTPVRTLLAIPDRGTNHNGGMLAFGRDGMLYISTGDEEGPDDPHEHGQDLGSLYGKLLRIDVDTPGNPAPPGFGYSIPPGNPFVGQPGVRPEIWAYGFRNPWRWSFDRLTGDIFIGDAGQRSWEEINFLPSGARAVNFGWDDREGAHCHEPLVNCLTEGRIDPILEYDHSNGNCAVIGGYRYRGNADPSLQGVYFFADYCSGRIWKGIQTAGSWTAVEALDTTLNISSFGEDEAGELYVTTPAGSVFRLVASSQPPVACSPRPRVVVEASRITASTLNVVVRASDSAALTNNEVQAIAFTRIDNGLVTIGDQVDRTTAFSFTLPGGTRSTQFAARRDRADRPMHVALSVTDRCGAWSTFVGLGTGST